MKKQITTSLLFLFGIFNFSTSFAQTPQAMNYQAVARNAGGNLLANQSIGLRISITDGNGGFLLYQETHSGVSTNQFGLFTLNIGNGTPVTGTFSSINWGSVTPWMQVELDPAGGTNYVSMGSSRLLSVPYAILAGGTGQWTTNGNDIYNANSGNVGIGTISPAAKLHIAGSIAVSDGSQGAGKVLTSDANGLATWQTPAAAIETDPEVGSTLLNQVPKWDGTTLVDGSIYDDGTIVVVGTPGWVDDSKLQAWNTNHTGKAFAVIGNNTAWSGPAAEFWNQGSGPTVSIDWAGSSTDRLVTFKNNGNEVGYIRTDGGAGFNGSVGIGTFTPSTARLVVSGTPAQEGLDLSSTDQYANLRVLRNSLSSIDNDMHIGFGSGPASSLHLYSDNYEVVTLAAGKVGIGTVSPVDKLDVSGNLTLSGSAFPTINFRPTGGPDSYIWSSNYGMLLQTSNSNCGIFIDGTANVIEPNYNNVTSMGSSGYHWTAVWATNGTIQTSDARMKKNIRNLDLGLNTVMQLRPVAYEWKDAAESDGENIGFIAQEVEKIIPQAVVHSSLTEAQLERAKAKNRPVPEIRDPYGMKYSEMIPVLTKAIQEQQQQIEELKKEISILKSVQNK